MLVPASSVRPTRCSTHPSASWEVWGQVFLDLLASRLPPRDNDYYRYIYLWIAVFQMLAVIFLWQVYRGWLRHGGRSGYVPPSVNGEI
jgi:hypothetical protein